MFVQYIITSLLLVVYLVLRTTYHSVKALVRWATGKRSTNRLPKLSLITLSPPLNSGILGLRMGLYVPTPRFFSLGTQGE